MSFMSKPTLMKLHEVRPFGSFPIRSTYTHPNPEYDGVQFWPYCRSTLSGFEVSWFKTIAFQYFINRIGLQMVRKLTESSYKYKISTGSSKIRPKSHHGDEPETTDS